MRNWLNVLASVTFAGLVASQAQASVLVTASGAGVQNTSVGGTTTVTFENGCAGYAGCSNVDIRLGSQWDSATPAGDNTHYSTVTGGKTSTFSIGSAADYFGLYWGSLDSYNYISFLLNGNLVSSFSGSQIPSLVANGNQQANYSNRYINFFFTNSSFDTVKFYSASNSFETDNHAFRKSSVPEPMNIILMGLGLLGLIAARKRMA